MANTYQSFYQNEKRALQLEIDDNDGTDFIPSAAFVEVQDSSGNPVVAERSAYVSGNTIRIIIGTIVTGTPGKYKVIWKIQGNQNEPGTSTHIYYHITELEIQQK